MARSVAWRKLLVFVPLLVTVFLIYVAGQWNRGTLVVEGEAPFVVAVTDGSMIQVKATPFRQSLWADQYRVTVTKVGYAPYQQEVQVQRGSEVIVRPVFNFLPVWQEVATVKTAAAAFIAQGGVGPLVSNWQQLVLAGEDNWPAVPVVLMDGMERLILAPGGQRAVALAKKEQVLWYELASGRSSSLSSTYASFAWSPTGQSLLAFNKNKQEGGSVVWLKSAALVDTLTTLTDMSGVSFYWAPQGNQFVFIPNGSLAERNIYLFDLNSRRKDKLTTKGNVVTVRWHPSGKQLLYETVVAGGLQPELHLLTLATSEDKILPLTAKLSKVAWLAEQVLAVVMPAKELGTDSETTLADVLDKIASVKDQLAAGPTAQVEARAEVIYRFDLKSSERTAIYTPADKTLLLDELAVVVPDEVLRARSGSKIYELRLVP